MRIALMISFISIFVALGGPCSSGPENINLQTQSANPGLNTSTPVVCQSPSGDLKEKKDLRDEYEAMQASIKQQSTRLKLEDLRGVVSDTITEMRIWVGFGLAIPDCFILENISGKEMAFYIPSTVDTNEERVGLKAQGVMAKFALGEPGSGWDELNRFLKKEGINSTIKLSMDSNPVAVPDGKFVAIELRSGSLYNMVYFSLYTESKDGKKALGVCRRIADEFNIKMDCGNTSP